MRTFILLSLLALLAGPACRTRPAMPTEASGPQLRFGSGGGITGAVTTYYLLENGKLYRHTSLPDSVVYLHRLARSERQALFARAESLNLPAKALMQPGDIYRFLEYRTDTDSARAVWGAPGAKVNEGLRRFYQDLMQHTQITE